MNATRTYCHEWPMMSNRTVMTDEKFPSDFADRFQLRMPDGMRDRIKDEAAKHGRSMNAEIIHRLEQSLLRGPVDAMFSDEVIQAIADRVCASIKGTRNE